MIALTTATFTKSAVINTPKALYKYLLRRVQLLPTEDAQKYYQHMVRQGFNQHADEIEQDRIQQIIQQAVKDSDWVMKKYKITNTEAQLKPRRNTSGEPRQNWSNSAYCSLIYLV